MKNIMLLLQKINDKSSNNQIVFQKQLFDEINYLIFRIKISENISEATIYFDLLDKIQLNLSILLYKEHVLLIDELKQFVINFDTLCDINERLKIFTKIKRDQYICDIQASVILSKFLWSLKNELVQVNKITPLLPLLSQEIDNLFLKIKNCNNKKDADIYFDQLQKIQDNLAELLFVYDAKLSSDLVKFISDCDRLDDPWLREYLFNFVKQN
ncbi:MAG: hypothetical protein WC707_05800 [Candidatus Babeliaceae bacterium]|jgi:hypothetical protein